jgi:chorismate mutase/prephenate dehydratase
MKKSPESAERALSSLRRRIDVLDGRIVGLLNQRTRLAMEIGRIKHQRGDAVFTPGREREVVRRVAAASTGPLGAAELRAIYREIMSVALSFEGGLTVVVLKGDGAAARLAVRQRLGECTRIKTVATPAQVLSALQREVADFALVTPAAWSGLKSPALAVVDRVRVDGVKGAFCLVCGRGPA